MGSRATPAFRRSSTARLARALGIAALGALALSAGDGPQLGARLNHRLAPGEDTNAWAVSPDGKRFFYTVTQPVFDGGQVFVAPSDGGHTALPLTAPLPSGRDLPALMVSPDGQRLVYTADQDTADQYEIYSVPTDGSQAPVKLNGPLSPSGDVYVSYFRFTPDGSRVVFMAESRLYSARTDGSQPAIELAPATVMGLFRITSDGARVVFLSGQLYSVPVDGSAAPLQLSVGSSSISWEFQVSPDGSRAIYRPFTITGSRIVYRVFAVAVDGSSAPVLLFGPVTEGADAPILRISPDSLRVAHRSPALSAPSVPRVLESAPIDGSAPAVTLNDPGNVGYDFRWTQDGRVVFGFTPGGGGSAGIYVVPGDRSQNPQRITGTSTFPTPMSWEVTPQGRVVFVGYDGTYDLYSVPLDGSAAPIQLNPPMVPNGNIIDGNVLTPSFRLTPRGDALVYVADQETDQVFEGFYVPCDGSAHARKINRTPAPGGNLTQYIMAFTPDSRRLIYGADQEEDQLYEFFTSTLIGNPTAGDSTPLPPGQPVHH